MSRVSHENFIKAVLFVYEHIDQPICLEDIAKSVGVSVSSLKRLFIESTEQTPGAFIRKFRMELAFRSLQSRNDSILEVALSTGFDDQSAFSRCFKKVFGYSPTEARKKTSIVRELDSMTLDDPSIVELTDLTIQSVTEQGLYFESAKNAWGKLKTRLTKDELSDDFMGMFIGIGHDNPHEGDVPEDKVRFSAGIVLSERDLNLGRTTIVGGKYARFHYEGKPTNLGLAYHYIYGRWREESVYEIDSEKPAFIVFEKLPNSLEKQDLLIHVPLKV